MKYSLPYITLVQAPGGYGKTYFINNLIESNQDQDYITINYIHQKDGFINCLIMSFGLKNINPPISSQLIDWYKFFSNLNKKLLIVIENIELVKDKEVFDFIDFFITNNPKNIYFIFSSAKKLNITQKVISKSFKLIEKEDLVFNINSMKKLWQKNDLELTQKDNDFFRLSNGWNQAIILYLQYSKNEISENKFDFLIKEAIFSLFSDLDIKRIFSDEINPQLKTNFLEKEKWSQMIIDFMSEKNKNNYEYWNYLARQDNTEVNQAILYLERALSIVTSINNPLKQNNYSLATQDIYNRLIYSYSINSDYNQVDQIFSKTEKYTEEYNKVNSAIYYYMKANRLRQKSLYKEAFDYLKTVLDIESSDNNVLKFQTKSYVLKGLIYYQVGEYQKTREYYQKAIYLAKAEKNYTLEIEITIMLAFLNVWEGKNIDILPPNIKEIIASFPIKEQPLMWLNLAFYWILGENISIDSVELILNKIKIINDRLKYNFLIPLIADIEARMLRYKGDYESAFYHHKIAINNLSHDSFEYIHAKLNMSLTLIKTLNIESAKIELNEVYNLARESGSLGLLKEAEILLKQTDNSFKIEKVNSGSNEIFNNQNYIQIDSFGGFTVKVNGQDNIKWSRKKAKNLFIYLLFNPRGIHRETLAETLFPDDMQPLKNLDVHIHFIRKIFDWSKDRENSIIIFRNSCYFLNKSFNYVFDIDSFNSNYMKWLKTNDTKLKILLSEQIISLYKGEFLPEIDFADEWQSERENYRKKIIEVIKYLLKNYDNDKNNEIFEKLIYIDPLTEENYIEYMRFSVKNKALLKIIYKRYIKTMKNQLSLDPAITVTNLYNDLIKIN